MLVMPYKMIKILASVNLAKQKYNPAGNRNTKIYKKRKIFGDVKKSFNLSLVKFVCRLSAIKVLNSHSRFSNFKGNTRDTQPSIIHILKKWFIINKNTNDNKFFFSKYLPEGQNKTMTTMLVDVPIQKQ